MKNLIFFTASVLLGLFLFVSCEKENNPVVETKTVDFEDLSIGNGGYWNGSDLSGDFTSSGMTFTNEYNTSYSSWQGYAYSQKADVVTEGFNNQYSVFDGDNGTNKFIIYYPPYGADSYAGFAPGEEKLIRSIDLCNSSYAALSMKNGDNFAKKFGGVTGNDPDWFKVTIIGYDAAGDSVKAVDFYLADYRPANNSNDYIINKWTKADLSSLGKINKITFRFSSTDNGAYGMNTPAIVCLDNIKYEEPLEYVH